MDYYFDIHLNPSKDINISFIRNKLYEKFHKAMVDLHSTNIGVSFPNLKKKIDKTVFGNIIRVHSTRNKLEELQKLDYLNALMDYCQTSEILQIPKDIKGYQIVSRIRQTMSEAKLKKRIVYQKEKGTLKTENDIKAYIKQYKVKMFNTSLNNAYLELQSISTNNRYRIYIKFGEIQDHQVVGEFNKFGLSNMATIPIF
jgi:CRISPR-associated endonuclease Csy4